MNSAPLRMRTTRTSTRPMGAAETVLMVRSVRTLPVFTARQYYTGSVCGPLSNRGSTASRTCD